MIRLGVPPAGYRYVRVASDILLISVGTSMVVDAIQDLGGMSLEADQALRKALAEAGVDVSSLRSKHSFRAGDADRKV